ncbi:NERD domain-containing protein [Halobacillus litoralis]|uniref:NERD domain-containing protein n=1 Tax=Halobacillus litoralis TaxID=45668 RepID=A0A845FGN3_9BACI|nr:nuclease-related domain-containing protein [Halobacillus litoralis]MYL72687.1 NERD domain-containing protein [Halobacillus litoralis]
MAQLIKLNDYISRYETNIYQYPRQYVKLKKDHWNKMKKRFEQGWLEEPMERIDKREEQPRRGIKNFLKLRSKVEGEETSENLLREDLLPSSEEELKQYYLDGLIPFQLKWATTTLREKSYLDPSYKQNSDLKYFLQRLPDTFLLMFEPVVQMKNTEVEIDHLLIGPSGIEIISLLSHPYGETIHPTSEKSWNIEKEGVQSKVLSPMHSLRRTETFIKSVLSNYQLDFPYRKVVLSKTMRFASGQAPYQTDWIGKDRYTSWLHEKRAARSPLKHDQLKVAEALLNHCSTIAVKRPEWDMEDDFTEG